MMMLLSRLAEHATAATRELEWRATPGQTPLATEDITSREPLSGSGAGTFLKTARVLVNPDAIHTCHYVQDVAVGLSTLGCAAADAYGRPWMLPCAPAGSMRELVARLSHELRREIRLAGVPRWMVKAIGVFVPLVREVDEMLYQWDEPFVINDRRFRERFRREPTDVNEAAAATVAWAKQHYATT